MDNKIDKSAIAWLIAVCVIISLILLARGLSSEKKRYEDNYEALTRSFTELKVNDSLNAAEVSALRLTKSEMEERLGEDAELIRKLTKGKDTKAVEIVEVVRTDSVLIPIAVSDSGRTFRSCDEWRCVDGEIFGDSVSVNIRTKESLAITESLVKKKFLFIKLPTKIFGYKSKALDVVSKCPGTTITNVEYITVED